MEVSMVTHTYLDVVEDVGEDLLLCDAEMWVIILGVRADVDHAIHVQVQVVKLWDLQTQTMYMGVPASLFQTNSEKKLILSLKSSNWGTLYKT
jgi:hypothetical protein